MRLDFRTGILTSFITPTGKKKIAYNYVYRGSSFYLFISMFALFADLTWVIMIFLSLFGIVDWGDFVRITAIAFILEFIYKMSHHKYKYF